MWKKSAFVSLLVLWIITIGVFGYFFYKGRTMEVDKRTKIELNQDEKNMILSEMRELLKGVQGIIRAVSRNDFKEVAIVARSKGMVMASEAGHHPGLFTKLPMNFKKLGIGVHKSFDELADKAHTMSGPEILQETAKIMNSCVACHATYRITD